MAPSVLTENGKQGEVDSESDRLGSPIPPLKVELSEDDIRETAFEILVAVCGEKPVTFRSTSFKSEPKIQTNKSLTSSAASKMKSAFGLQSSGGSTEVQRSSSFKSKKPMTISDVFRVQMRISESSESRTRRALTRAIAGQASKRNGSMIVPLELLQNISPSTFGDEGGEYQPWLRRQLKVLEAGLLAHPLVPGDGGMDAHRLKQSLRDMAEGHRTLDKGRNSEVMQSLRSAAMGRATRAHNSEYGDFLHWADGFPLNAHIYVALLSAIFQSPQKADVIAEMDEALETIQKTWGVLGIDQTMHDMLLAWVYFRQFVITGQTGVKLLQLSESLLEEVAKDLKGNTKAEQLPFLKSTLSSMQFWAERRLLAYHDSFPGGASDIMAGLLAVAVRSAQILGEYVSRENRRGKEELNIPLSRVDVYVRSSVRTAFAQLMETVDSRRRSFKAATAPPPALAVLAQDTMAFAMSEVDNFSPVLKRWHPFAGGVAAATLHGCYSREFKQYLSSLSTMTLDTVAILKASDDLEKRLVGIAVEDGAECDDGGKSLIREMPPYEADQVMGELTRKWVEDNVQKMRQWVDRNIQQEKWTPGSNSENYAPSGVEVLRFMEESLDAYFAMPAEQYPDLLEQLVAGLDSALQRYVTQTVNPCGTKDQFIPPMPPLTRCKVSKSWRGSSKSKGKVEAQRIRNNRKTTPSSSGDLTYSLPYLCVRINTLEHINNQLQFLEKRIQYAWKKDEPTPPPKSSRMFGKAKPEPPPPVVAEPASTSFQNTRAAIKEGTRQLIDSAAYRVVFIELHDVFGEGLYAGDVTTSRVSPVLEQLDAKLGEIAETSAESLRNSIAGALMRACFDCLLRVLLAGGPSRAYKEEDADQLKDDMYALKELFLADGEGLPLSEVDQVVAPAAQVLTLFELASTELVQIYLASIGQGSKSSSKAPVPATTGKWSATDPNTLLRVLCYRGDDTASKFLKKTYHLKKASA